MKHRRDMSRLPPKVLPCLFFTEQFWVTHAHMHACVGDFYRSLEHAIKTIFLFIMTSLCNTGVLCDLKSLPCDMWSAL